MRSSREGLERPGTGRAAALAAAAVIGGTLMSGCSSAGPTAGAMSDRCLAPAEARQQDVDRDDSPEAPWPHTPGTETVVYFDVGRLTPRYAQAVRAGAESWSRSPCIDARVVDTCPEGANCSTVRLARASEDDDTDGESSSDDVRRVRKANTIMLFTGILDETSDNGMQATVTHEMGHALGLMHREDPDSLMNAETDEGTDPTPDAIDYANLVALYGDPGADSY